MQNNSVQFSSTSDASDFCRFLSKDAGCCLGSWLIRPKALEIGFWIWQLAVFLRPVGTIKARRAGFSHVSTIAIVPYSKCRHPFRSIQMRKGIQRIVLTDNSNGRSLSRSERLGCRSPREMFADSELVQARRCKRFQGPGLQSLLPIWQIDVLDSLNVPNVIDSFID
eukprot:s1403_g31.t1